MTIFDKLQQLHPLVIIVLIACVLWYIGIMCKIIYKYNFTDSLRCIVSTICSTIIMLALIITFVKTNDLERFEGLVIMTYMTLTIISNTLN